MDRFREEVSLRSEDMVVVCWEKNKIGRGIE